MICLLLFYEIKATVNINEFIRRTQNSLVMNKEHTILVEPVRK
jgi:hypothetical protein